VTVDARNIKETPFIADAGWNNAWPTSDHPVPARVAAEEQMYNIGNWSQMVCYVMRRHKDGVNVCFGDGTVRHVQTEELWNLRWNRESSRRDIGDALEWLKSGF
jgi:prepilin-type processing-associated H-X9-DG protein